MELKEYQERAYKTDQNPPPSGVDFTDLTIPLLGLVGEAGTLHSEYKKYLRDRDSYRLFKDQFRTELGDVLWYLSNIASRLDFDLDEIASTNISKIENRWLESEENKKLFDAEFDEEEQLPRKFEVVFKEIKRREKIEVKISINNVNIGDKISDNAHEDDGYRFHDAFHLAYAAILGWSPVIRALLKRKRKSDSKIDEVEDGQRAIVTEEAITIFVYQHARNFEYFTGMTYLDWNILETIRNLVSGLEVEKCSFGQWEKAIFSGYEVFRSLKEHSGGKIGVDLDNREISFLGPN